jgi:cysteine desulfurase
MAMHVIYLDHNSTTPLLPAVVEAMLPHLGGAPGNPASAHSAGRRARRALEDARERIASLLGADADEVVFTSGATEANNLALFGLAGEPPGRIVASPIEHPSVAEPLRQLAASGFGVDFLPVSREGSVAADAFGPGRTARLSCVMLVNHETGAIQPVESLARAVGPSVLFHCDATQAVGKIAVNFHQLGVHTLSLSAHKFHGPVGIGALLVRKGTKLRPRTWGGHQQQGRRPGTEPVPLAVGMAAAVEIAVQEQAERWKYVAQLRGDFLNTVQRLAAPVVVNGPLVPGAATSPYTLNVSFPGCRSDALLMNLDLAGVACSTGSACSSGSLLPSPVLRTMAVPNDVLQSAMRFSFSALVTMEDIAEAAQRVVTVVNRLRQAPVD